jgi:hypothetical protein
MYVPQIEEQRQIQGSFPFGCAQGQDDNFVKLAAGSGIRTKLRLGLRPEFRECAGGSG